MKKTILSLSLISLLSQSANAADLHPISLVVHAPGATLGFVTRSAGKVLHFVRAKLGEALVRTGQVIYPETTVVLTL